MEAKKLDHFTFEQYLDIEVETGVKHEYHDGVLVAMAGGTVEHALVASNLLIDLGLALRKNKSNSRPLNGDVKLKVEANNKILIDQYQPLVDIYSKKSDLWKINRIEGLNQNIFIPSLDIHLGLKEIYNDVLA